MIFGHFDITDLTSIVFQNSVQVQFIFSVGLE